MRLYAPYSSIQGYRVVAAEMFVMRFDRVTYEAVGKSCHDRSLTRAPLQEVQLTPMTRSTGRQKCGKLHPRNRNRIREVPKRIDDERNRFRLAGNRLLSILRRLHRCRDLQLPVNGKSRLQRVHFDGARQIEFPRHMSIQPPQGGASCRTFLGGLAVRRHRHGRTFDPLGDNRQRESRIFYLDGYVIRPENAADVEVERHLADAGSVDVHADRWRVRRPIGRAAAR